MDIEDVDPALVGTLRSLGGKYGPLGVARVAAQLCGHEVVPIPAVPVTCRSPEPWTSGWSEQRADGRAKPGRLERFVNLVFGTNKGNGEIREP